MDDDRRLVGWGDALGIGIAVLCGIAFVVIVAVAIWASAR